MIKYIRLMLMTKGTTVLLMCKNYEMNQER